MKAATGQGLIAELLRFVAAGAGNTLLTLLVYHCLVFWISPSVAYGLSWLVGLAIVALVYPTKVFRGSAVGMVGRIGFAAVYATSFFIGLWVVRHGAALGHERLAVLAALAVTIPYNYVAMRLVLRAMGNQT